LIDLDEEYGDMKKEFKTFAKYKAIVNLKFSYQLEETKVLTNNHQNLIAIDSDSDFNFLSSNESGSLDEDSKLTIENMFNGSLCPNFVEYDSSLNGKSAWYLIDFITFNIIISLD